MRVPPFAVTYVVAGAACLIFGFRRHKSLLALGALLISIATINAYIEEWPSFDHGNFASVAPVLLFVFMMAYTALTMSLAEKIGGQTFSRRFVISMLPFLYLLVSGVVIELPHFGALENPPLAPYLCIIFTVVLHVPAFAGGKSKFQSRRSSANGVAYAGMRKLLESTGSILAAPLFTIWNTAFCKSNQFMVLETLCALTWGVFAERQKILSNLRSALFAASPTLQYNHLSRRPPLCMEPHAHQ